MTSKQTVSLAAALSLVAGMTFTAHASPDFGTPLVRDFTVPHAVSIPHVTPQPEGSGVRGSVMFRSGDLMPPIDPSRSKITPMRATLQVFKGDALVCTSSTDKDGNFSIKLPAGQYRLVVQVFTAQDVTRSLDIQDGQWKDLNIVVDGDVTF